LTDNIVRLLRSSSLTAAAAYRHPLRGYQVDYFCGAAFPVTAPHGSLALPWLMHIAVIAASGNDRLSPLPC
jgi:hypothetical protein